VEEHEQDQYIVNEARRYDYDRWLTALFAPAAAREAIFTLLAFNAEIARIRETVSEPLLGEIRLQWWREALEKIANGDTPPEHPVVSGLAGVIGSYGLPIAEFRQMVDARAADLDAVPFRTKEDWLAYADATGGLLAGLIFRLWGDETDAGLAVARHTGQAYALAGMIRSIPYHVRQDVLHIPGEMIEAKGLTADNLLIRDNREIFFAIVHDLGVLARDQQRAAAQQVKARPRSERPYYRLSSLTSLYLRRLEKAGYDPAHPALDVGAVRKIIALATGR
jgi:phytoene synthase